MKARKLLVLGGGPTGLMAAIYARLNGLDAEVRSPTWPSATDAATIESLPGQTMALLVETGVLPRAVGVQEVFSEQVHQWGDGPITRKITTGRVHVSRPGLDLALLAIAERLGTAFVTQRIDRKAVPDTQQNGLLVFDASGRNASSATAVMRPKRPVVARQWLFEANAGRMAPFAIAALSSGYAYRMGNAVRICLGVVGSSGLMRGNWSEIREELIKSCDWFVEDLPLNDAEVGRSGAASMQWSQGSLGPWQIGDACFAQDALSSQGLAAGLVRAVQCVRAHLGRPATPSPVDSTLMISHARLAVAGIVATSPFAGDALWAEYLGFLRSDSVKGIEPPAEIDADVCNSARVSG
ncbi:hypothetical protein N2597_22545 (plasmid) [Rhizobium sophoriradicis]|uniref:hypothetical protein n=1 Tax=Rhizobium sophoriradicis TaxID=1535245 RepID=UPI001615160C|nr:hypothetical protein N2597_22545 [Rhizobium leguminosarum bv. phaseoli]